MRSLAPSFRAVSLARLLDVHVRSQSAIVPIPVERCRIPMIAHGPNKARKMEASLNAAYFWSVTVACHSVAT